MSRYHSYINSAKDILGQYEGHGPFALFLKKFFSLKKKYGSKDRKQISHLCYCYFRIGKMKAALPGEERLLIGLFLCSNESNEILQEIKFEWNDKVSLPVNEKLILLNAKDSYEDIFPFIHEISDGIGRPSFILSHITQPDVFLRLRPGKEHTVKQKLKNAEINFQVISDSCLALPNASKIDLAIELNKEAVVQDYSSQRVEDFFPLIADGRPLTAWDCCAASGGKSIMLYDHYPNIELTVSDVRESVLVNLKKRFSEAGISSYKSMVGDLSLSPLTCHPELAEGGRSLFHLILADVPCSGSGTWGRTPEQLYSFDEEKISEYASLQKKIISAAIPYLRPGGHLLYSTCSVFKKENEEVVDFLMQNFPLQLINREVLKGYDKKADTMFAALLCLKK